MKVIKRILKGMGYLEDYGEHPGNIFIFIFLFICVFLGVEANGFFGGLIGFGICFFTLGIPYFIGCYERAIGQEKINAKKINS
ncbi:MAG: hypothetical protein ACOC22_01725 [bacterium]